MKARHWGSSGMHATLAKSAHRSQRGQAVLHRRRGGPTMAYDGYECLRVRVERGVAWVTIDHPPINLFDMPLIRDMDRVGRELEADAAVRVVVLQSADPEFFIAHADVGLILG